MSHVYSDHDLDWDEPHSVTVKRYTVPRDESPGREVIYRHGDSTGNRELVFRHSSDSYEDPVMVRRYDRDLDYYDAPRSDRDYSRYDRDYYDGECNNPSPIYRMPR